MDLHSQKSYNRTIRYTDTVRSFSTITRATNLTSHYSNNLTQGLFMLSDYPSFPFR